MKFIVTLLLQIMANALIATLRTLALRAAGKDVGTFLEVAICIKFVIMQAFVTCLIPYIVQYG